MTNLFPIRPDEPSGGSGDDEQREPLPVDNDSKAADWLREHLGSSRLAGYFRRDNDIVFTSAIDADGYIPPSPDTATPAPVRTTTDQLTARIQYNYWPYKAETKGGRGASTSRCAAMFPRSASLTALSAPDLLTNIRDLRGVVHTPIVRGDGTILATPGYDEPSRLLYLPDAELDVDPVPDEPTTADVDNALALLEEMIAGFRFISDHDLANYLGLLLTPLLRELVPPPYKLGAIGAPQPGSGKTLLATCARLIHGGVFRAEMPEDDAELRKQITAILEDTTGPVVNFDNVTGTVRSSVLAGLLTSAQWGDRLLGTHVTVSGVNDRLWLITGNNLSLGGDLVRRAVWVTIDPGCPDPHLRTDFAIDDLEGWVRDRRGQLIHALLVLVRAWITTGSPTERRTGDGYARWVETVDGILHNAGVAGTFDHRESVRQETGADDQEWADFLAAAHKVFGEEPWTAKELLAKVQEGDFELNPMYAIDRPISLDALPTALTSKLRRQMGGVGNLAKPLGHWLRNRDGRWAGSRTVRFGGHDRKGINLWRIETAGGVP